MEYYAYLRNYSRTKNKGYKYRVVAHGGEIIAIFKTIDEARKYAINQYRRFTYIETKDKVLGHIDRGRGIFYNASGNAVVVSPSYNTDDGKVYHIKKDGSITRVDLGY